MTKHLVDAAGDPPGGAQRIAGPGELLQAVPYLLGFHPARSLVLVGLRDGILVVTARLDLADTAADAGTLAGTLASMCDGGTTEVVAAVYGDDRPDASGLLWTELPWTGLTDRLVDLFDALPCRLSDVLLVVDGRWWSYSCGSDECCPRVGNPLPAAPSAFATRATVQGVVPLVDRTALAAVLDPLPAPARDALLPLLARADQDAVAATIAGSSRHERSVKRALFAAARASTQARWQPPDDADAAWFASALTSSAVRDSVWLAVDSRKLDGRVLWRELARRSPSPYNAPPLFLHGWASWRAGDGALAHIAAERAIASDPDYSAADLLLAALSRGVDPRSFPRLSQRLTDGRARCPQAERTNT